MRSITSRSVAAVAAVAMSTAGLVGLASTAQAAPTSLLFNCSASILSNQEFGLNAEVTAPETVELGETFDVSFEGAVAVPNSTRGAAYSLLSGRALEGGATIDAQFGGNAIALDATLPKTDIPSASGVGAQDFTIDGFEAPLKMTKADGSVSDVNVTCTAKAPATVVATVNVVETPTEEPTEEPTEAPTEGPTEEPTDEPTVEPTPTEDPSPTTSPTTPPTETQPDPIKAVVGFLVGLLKKLACKIFRC